VSLKPPSPITVDEYDALIALWEAAGLHHRPAGRDSREAFGAQNDGGTQFPIGIKTDGGTLAGVVLATHDGRKGWINRLAVLPEFRRQGVALALIRAAEETLRAQGIDVIAALIEPGNDPSLAVFQSAGYDDWPGMHYVSKRSNPDS
jgi:ribosomal protein S18 acetylase RimI-like enzyme